jgi:two-component system nitrogen regulation response regulator NtrX
MAKILIIDDEKHIIKTLSAILQDEGHVVFAGESGSDAFAFLAENEVDLIILDVWLPDADGIDLLERIKKQYNDVAVIMISGHGSIDIAVKSTRMGAFDFIEKPPSMERVITSVNNALEQVRLKRENIKLREGASAEDEMIGCAESVSEIRHIVETAARTNARVFITGDSGTGKELIARAIYQRSQRCNKAFVKVNCAAIPDELIESELFGHEKGAFTGAVSRRIGKFELANGGTLFLDEVCDMSLPAQAKVLRVLQEQQFERVGGNDTITVDVRVISATNIDIRKAIEEGKFREDLYYRLNVIPIEAPLLTERRGDILHLSKYFLDKFSNEHGIGIKKLSEDALELLCSHSWPGNVRELKNIMERLIVMVPGEVIESGDIHKYMESYDYDDVVAQNYSSLRQAREDFERRFISQALKQHNNNISVTAKNLGIERTNLHRKIRQYDINLEKL